VAALGNTHWTASMAYVRMGQPQTAYEELTKAHRTMDLGSMQMREWLRFCRFTASILIDDARDLPAAGKWIDVAESTASLAGLAGDLRSARRERGHYELAMGDAEAAAKAFQDLLEGDQGAIDGESVIAFEGLAEALDHQGRAEEAIGWLRRAADFYEADANFRKAAEMWRRIDTMRQARSKG
jgi:tetratricopeptide (TPR) repeat protein